MAEITVTNTDWSVLDAVKAALSGAEIGGEAVFASVAMSTSIDHVRAVQLTGPMPKAIVLYKGTGEEGGSDGRQCCRVSMELILATRISSGMDAAGRFQEILRLKNAAINAVESDRPAGAVGAASAGTYRPPMRWGPADIELSEPGVDPWVLCRVGLEAAYELPDGTSH